MGETRSFPRSAASLGYESLDAINEYGALLFDEIMDDITAGRVTDEELSAVTNAIELDNGNRVNLNLFDAFIEGVEAGRRPSMVPQPEPPAIPFHPVEFNLFEGFIEMEMETNTPTSQIQNIAALFGIGPYGGGAFSAGGYTITNAGTLGPTGPVGSLFSGDSNSGNNGNSNGDGSGYSGGGFSGPSD
jgi:hypothetical protein